jgi:enediyne biosynthesis protein E4
VLTTILHGYPRFNGPTTASLRKVPSPAGALLSLLHSGWGMRLLDFDNNGWKDLFVVQGHVDDIIGRTRPNRHYREPMLVARNTGNGFVDASTNA